MELFSLKAFLNMRFFWHLSVKLGDIPAPWRHLRINLGFPNAIFFKKRLKICADASYFAEIFKSLVTLCHKLTQRQ